MAYYSKAVYVADGAVTIFSIPFTYISRSHVKVSVGEVGTTAFTFLSDSSISLNTAPPNGTEVVIYRDTPKTAKLVDFQNGSKLSEADLDRNADQLFYLVQEQMDKLQESAELGYVDGYPVGVFAARDEVAAYALSVAISTSDMVNGSLHASLAAAVASESTAGKTIVLSRPLAVGSDVVVPADRSVVVNNGGFLTGGGNIIFQGKFEAPRQYVFQGSGTVTFSATPEVFPEWFGFATASANNAPALQKAINSLTSGAVRLPATGTFLCGPIIPKSNVDILGQGWGCVLKMINNIGGNLISLESMEVHYNKITISNFSIDGNKANNPGGNNCSGINFHGEDITVSYMNIYDTAGGSLVLGGPGRKTVVHNKCANPSSGNGWSAISITGGDDIRILFNDCSSNDGQARGGVNLEPNPNQVLKRILIMGNNVRRCNILASANNVGSIIEDLTIMHNWIDGYNTYSPSLDGAAGIYCDKITGRLKILSNNVRSPESSQGCIMLRNTSNYTVADNELFARYHAASGGFGMTLNNSSYGDVYNNHVVGTDGATRFGIMESGTTNYVNYHRNTFSNIQEPMNWCVGANNTYDYVPPSTAESVTTSLASPQPSGTPVVFSIANAKPGYEYQVQLFTAGGGWTTPKAYGEPFYWIMPNTQPVGTHVVRFSKRIIGYPATETTFSDKNFTLT